MPDYTINPTHVDTTVAGQKYQKDLHDYYTVNNMNSSLKKIG